MNIRLRLETYSMSLFPWHGSSSRSPLSRRTSWHRIFSAILAGRSVLAKDGRLSHRQCRSRLQRIAGIRRYRTRFWARIWMSKLGSIPAHNVDFEVAHWTGCIVREVLVGNHWGFGERTDTIIVRKWTWLTPERFVGVINVKFNHLININAPESGYLSWVSIWGQFLGVARKKTRCSYSTICSWRHCLFIRVVLHFYEVKISGSWSDCGNSRVKSEYEFVKSSLKS